MKRTLLFALTIPLLLTGCAAQQVTKDWETWRKDLQGAEHLCFEAEVTAEWPDSAFTYKAKVETDAEETAVTLTAPATVAGVICRSRGEGDTLEYDGAILSLDALRTKTAAPCAAAPLLLDALRRGRTLWTARTEDGSSAALENADGDTVTVWRGADGSPVYAEIAKDGAVILTLRLAHWQTE